MKFHTLIAVAAIATFGFAPKAMAFHDGGVAYCDGCHTMHNSGVSSTTDPVTRVTTYTQGAMAKTRTSFRGAGPRGR